MPLTLFLQIIFFAILNTLKSSTKLAEVSINFHSLYPFSITETKASRGRLVSKGTDVPILNLAVWPTAEDLELDDSQYRALKMALTKEFAVIQGPPGTGKTYLGLKVRRQKLNTWTTALLLMSASIPLKFYGFSDSVFEFLVCSITNANHELNESQREANSCNHC